MSVSTWNQRMELGGRRRGLHVCGQGVGFGAPRCNPRPQLSTWACRVAAPAWPRVATRWFHGVRGPALEPGAPTGPLGSPCSWRALSRSLPAQRVPLWPALLGAPHQAARSSRLLPRGGVVLPFRRGDTPALPLRPAGSRGSSELDHRGGLWAVLAVLSFSGPLSLPAPHLAGGKGQGASPHLSSQAS